MTSDLRFYITELIKGLLGKELGWVCARAGVPPSYLSPHGPRSEHVAAGVELVRLHLVVAGAAVVGDDGHVRGTFENLDVMHDGLVALSYRRLVLGDRKEVQEDKKNTFRHHAVKFMTDRVEGKTSSDNRSLFSNSEDEFPP